MKKAVAFAWCFLLAVALCACSPPAEDIDEPAETAGAESAVAERQTYDLTEEGAPGSSVTVETTTVGEAVPAADSINEQLRQLADAYVAEKTAEDVMIYAGGDGAAYTHERAYEVVYEGGGMISVVAHSFDDSETAARGSEEIYAYVFDTGTGARVALSDVLGSDWADILQRYVSGQIRASGQEDVYYPNYAELIPAALGGDCWYLTEGELHLLFNADVIGPRMLGPLEFVYPLAQ